MQQRKDSTIEEIDARLSSANGDPYGDMPDVWAYLKYVMGGRILSKFLSVGTKTELNDASILITAKMMDGTLKLNEQELGLSLFINFILGEITLKLKVIGEECVSLKTIFSLHDELSENDDVAVALQIQAAIDEAAKRKLFKKEDALTIPAMNTIKAIVIELGKNPDPVDLLFQSIAGKTSSPVDAALAFIEKMMPPR